MAQEKITPSAFSDQKRRGRPLQSDVVNISRWSLGKRVTEREGGAVEKNWRRKRDKAEIELDCDGTTQNMRCILMFDILGYERITMPNLYERRHSAVLMLLYIRTPCGPSSTSSTLQIRLKHHPTRLPVTIFLPPLLAVTRPTPPDTRRPAGAERCRFR